MRRWIGCIGLLAMLAGLVGCGGADLPPGGKPAVAYWQRVLKQCPDLPAKVEAIVQGRGSPHYHEHDLPATEVRIYTDEGLVSYSASRIEMIVTDLDTPALKE